MLVIPVKAEVVFNSVAGQSIGLVYSMKVKMDPGLIGFAVERRRDDAKQNDEETVRDECKIRIAMRSSRR